MTADGTYEPNDAAMTAVTTALANHRVEVDNGRDPGDLATRVRTALDRVTADGTYPSPARVTTAAELDALPVDTVVLDFANIPRTKRRADSVMGAGWTHAGRSPLSSGMLADGHPLTVLFRPDAPQPRAEDGCVDRDWHAEAHARGDRLNALVAALHDAFAGRAHDGGFAAGIRGLLDENDRLRRDAPQPATDGDDAVERAARALNHHQPRPGDNGSWACLGCDVVAPTWAEFADHLAPTALAAARAGGSDGEPWPTYNEDIYDPPEMAAQRGGEAVDREALARLIHDAGERHAAEVTGCDPEPWASASTAYRAESLYVADAVLAARGDAAPTAPGPLTVKFDGGRRAVLDESNRIVGYLTGDTAPTEVEWGVRYPQGVEPDAVRRASSEQDALDKASGFGSGVVVMRFAHRGVVSPWQERPF